MSNTGWGAGAFAAGLANSLSGAIYGQRQQERQDARRAEERNFQIESFKLQTVLPQILANPDLVNSDALAQEFPTIFGKGSKDGKTRLQQLQQQMGSLHAQGAYGGVQPADRSDRAASPAATTTSVVGDSGPSYTGEPSGIPTVSGMGNEANPAQNRPAGDIGPVATLFGAPMLTQEQQLQREMSMKDRLSAAELRQRQQRAQMLAQAGPQYALNPEQMKTYLLENKLPPQRTPTPVTTAPGTFADNLARWEQEHNRKATSDEEIDLYRKWSLANDPVKAGAAGALTPEAEATARMVADNPSMLQGLTPTLTGGVIQAIAANPQLRAKYEAARMAPVVAAANQTLNAMKDLVTVDPNTGQVTGLTAGAASLYGSNILDRALSFKFGSAGATARAALNMVTGQQVLDMLKTMKEQSKTGATGFGQLSVRELGVLESAATMLKGEISQPRAAMLLKDIYDRLQKIVQPAAQAPAPGGQNAGAAPGATAPGAETPAASSPGSGGIAGARPAAPVTPQAGNGPAGMIVGHDGKLYLNGQPLP